MRQYYRVCRVLDMDIYSRNPIDCCILRVVIYLNNKYFDFVVNMNNIKMHDFIQWQLCNFCYCVLIPSYSYNFCICSLLLLRAVTFLNCNKSFYGIVITASSFQI